MKIEPLGDAALVVRVRDDFQSDPEGCLDSVSAVLRTLETSALPGVIDLAPAFTTVTVFYDPERVAAAGAPVEGIHDWLAARIHAQFEDRSLRERKPRKQRTVDIPVCYESEFAPDLETLAAGAKMKTADVVAAHAGAIYRVACMGFAPGFPYLTGLPATLATPRRATPRTRVAAGSVAIGGAQAGIYPQQSPGGWNVIGRTPLRLFDASRKPSSLLAIGDAVRFRPITRSEFERSAQ